MERYSTYHFHLMTKMKKSLSRKVSEGVKGHTWGRMGGREDGEEGKRRTITIFPSSSDDLVQHPCLKQLEQQLDLTHTCGYVTLLRTGAPRTAHTPHRRSGRKPSPQVRKPTAEERAKQHEISEFLDDLRELGIGEVKQTRVREQTPVESRMEEQNGTDSAELMPPAVQRIATEWVPLELSFGIPLFSERANQVICDKVSWILSHVTW